MSADVINTQTEMGRVDSGSGDLNIIAGWCQVAKFLSAPPTMCQPESSPHLATGCDDSVTTGL